MVGGALLLAAPSAALANTSVSDDGCTFSAEPPFYINAGSALLGVTSFYAYGDASVSCSGGQSWSARIYLNKWSGAAWYRYGGWEDYSGGGSGGFGIVDVVPSGYYQTQLANIYVNGQASAASLSGASSDGRGTG